MDVRRRLRHGLFLGILCVVVALASQARANGDPPPEQDPPPLGADGNPVPVEEEPVAPVGEPAVPEEPAAMEGEGAAPEEPAAPEGEPAATEGEGAAPVGEPAATEPAVPEPAVPEKPKPTTAYFRELMGRQFASVGDALRVLYLAESGKDEPGLGSAARTEYLVARGVVPAKWARDPKAPLTKGMLAHMVCRSLGIKGGLLNWATGQSRRYAFREAKFRGLMGGESASQLVTGAELLSVLRRVSDEKKGASQP